MFFCCSNRILWMVPIYSLDSVSVLLLLPAQSNSVCCGSERKQCRGRNCAAWKGVVLESFWAFLFMEYVRSIVLVSSSGDLGLLLITFLNPVLEYPL